jgi:CelD/BcsL family acetyltransferase involved in cellulose biosynthesis
VLRVWRVEEITGAKRLSQYRDDWQRLAQESTNSDLYQSYEWISTWLDAFWCDKPIAFLIVRNNEEIAGIAPLVPDPAGELWCPGSLVSPVNEHSMRTNILCNGNREEVLSLLLDHLRRTRGQVRIAYKDVMDRAWIAGDLQGILSRFGMAAVRIEEPSSPVVTVQGEAGDYYETRSAHLRHELRRKLKKIKQAGRVEHRVIRSPEDCDAAMDDIFAIEEKSWKAEAGSAFTSRAELARFYRKLADRAAANGWLRIHMLYFDSKPVAHLYGLVYKGRYYALKTSYDRAYSQLSPGVVLFDHAIRDAFSEGYSHFDMLGEESRWKSELATGLESHIHLCIFSNNQPRCRLCRLMHGRVKPFVKQKVPFLVSWKQKMRRLRVGREATARKSR